MQTPQGPAVSVSIAQDTIGTVATNLLGWFVTKDPMSATLTDTAVIGYDVGRTGAGQIPQFIPTFINPVISYSPASGLAFEWSK